MLPVLPCRLSIIGDNFIMRGLFGSEAATGTTLAGLKLKQAFCCCFLQRNMNIIASTALQGNNTLLTIKIVVIIVKNSCI